MQLQFPFDKLIFQFHAKYICRQPTTGNLVRNLHVEVVKCEFHAGLNEKLCTIRLEAAVVEMRDCQLHYSLFPVFPLMILRLGCHLF